MKAADVMTRTVASIVANASVVEALNLMLQNHVSGLPVVDADGNLVGMVTEGDFLRRAELDTERHHPRWLAFLLGESHLAREYVDAHARKVEEIMTREVSTVAEDTPLTKVVELMEENHYRRVPVVKDGRPVGVVSRADLIRAILKAAAKSMSANLSDAAIRQLIAAEIERQPWSPRSTVDYSVTNGVVELKGLVFTEEGRQAMRVMVENLPGVKRVDDHLALIEPMTGSFVPPP